MSTSRPSTTTVTGAVAAVLGLGLAAGATLAVRPSSTPAASEVTGVSVDATSDFASDAAALAYWTPQRRAEAQVNGRAYEASVAASSRPSSTVSESAEGSSPSSAEAADASSVSAVLGKPTATTGGVAHAIGALFFTLNGKNMMCSASSMWTYSRNVVLSAGHCVYDAKSKQYAKNITFVPAYQGLSANWAPYGVWRAKKIHTFPTWISRGDYNRDVSFTSFWPGGSLKKSVANTVGGQGLWYGGSYSWSGYMFGYPSNKTNGSKVLQACRMSANAYGSREVVVGCYFGHGASGGPWIYQYNGSTHLGYVRSVSSYITDTTAKYDFGPYFDSYVYKLMGAANADK